MNAPPWPSAASTPSDWMLSEGAIASPSASQASADATPGAMAPMHASRIARIRLVTVRKGRTCRMELWIQGGDGLGRGGSFYRSRRDPDPRKDLTDPPLADRRRWERRYFSVRSNSA